MRKTEYKNRRRKFLIIFIGILSVVLAAEIGYIALLYNRDNSSSPDSVNKDMGLNTPSYQTDTEDTSAMTPAPATKPANTSEKPVQQSDNIKEQINSMSLDEKIGQLVIVGLDGYEADEHARQMIEEYRVGGFILFTSNIQNSNQMLELLNSLKNINRANKVPLFLSVDEEGGRVSRLPDEFLKIPSNQIIGKLNNSSVSHQVGSIIGEELKSFGMNMDFAPVLDINSNPKNPIIGDRAFGTGPNLVSKLGVQTMKGLQSQNIIPVVKHFPGHGDTSTDSHVGLPKVDNDLKRLRNFELKPFARAIENGAEAVMVAHILLPEIDPDNPASFSKTIINDVLRLEMNYDGVVITDDFTMGAIVKNYNIGQAAVKSILAGGDIVLVCHDFEKQKAVISALKDAAQSGQLPMDRIDRSVIRILRLKQEHKITDTPASTVDPESINKKISALLK
ncbi:glycoside hydrolase family 3 domain protein [Ruminiclostridium papyrosolvens DSM 2782]|uniref:Glycoside hydrolase family 3 domain protein n=1 Tax=Ruminiclostridium papyrosolvens DSM 2782 TaxID=588581 RepID=F1TE63_9FIRM|nr:beta-N-acetylhexosaminidase [Ruminiclostridium papyrosolvens]EGD47303.1 glycoside hydrolase family 3 domain protein [Ruminiclostridium papyrosolvens DSM 2782]WES34649.1 beta-N-acetylhexosaminidase [Ruminiclostridium papyrosolvens DSM 2782]